MVLGSSGKESLFLPLEPSETWHHKRGAYDSEVALATTSLRSSRTRRDGIRMMERSAASASGERLREELNGQWETTSSRWI